MIDAEVRNMILEFLYAHRDVHFESSDFNNIFGIDKVVINRDLRYLIEKNLITNLKGLVGGDYIVRIHAYGIDFIESFHNINEAIKKEDIKDEDREILKKINIELKNELLKSDKDKNRIKEIVDILKKYSWITGYISVILALAL